MFEQAVREVKKKKICFVDDSITSRHPTEKILKQKNCLVDYFPSAASALKSFADNKYDLLIVDIALPDKANRLVHSARQMGFLGEAPFPVIIISETSDFSPYKQSLQSGPSKVILKPYADDILQNAMLALTPRLTHFGSADQAPNKKNVVTIKDVVEPATWPKNPTLASIPEVEIPVLTSMIQTSSDVDTPSAQLELQEKENLPNKASLHKMEEREPLSGFQKPEPSSPVRNNSAADEDNIDMPPLSMMESIQLAVAKRNPPTEEKIKPLNTSRKRSVKPIKTQAEAIIDSLDETNRIMASVTSQPSDNKLFFDKPKKQKKTPLKTQKIEPVQKQKKDHEDTLEFLHTSKVSMSKSKPVSARVKGGFLKIVRFMLILAALISGGTFWYLDQLPIEVNVVVVQQAPILSNIQAPGRVLSKRNIAVSARAAGQVIDIKVNEGDAVKKGQVLARLDDSEAKHNVTLINARLVSSQEDVAGAEKTYKRLKNALEFGAVTRRIVDDAEAIWKVLSAKQTEAEQELIGAEVKLDRLHIKAPFSGVVDSVFVQTGQWLFLAENILTLVDVSQRIVDIPMDVKHSARLNIGQEVTLSSEDFNGESWKEKIVKIGNDIKTEGSLSIVNVQVSLGRNLRIGQQVDATLRVASKNNALLLPHHVLFTHKNSPHVAVIEKGKIVFIPVVTGIHDIRNIEIVSGLHVGQKIINPESLRLEIGMNAVIN